MPKSPDPTDKHVGSRVRTRRLMLGLSQTKLADELGLTFRQVQKYEKGANSILFRRPFRPEQYAKATGRSSDP
jgi:transcriptional regulator with XRE-family HTH domain